MSVPLVEQNELRKQGLKRCNGPCGRVLPLETFGKKGNRYQSYCAPCRKIKQNVWNAAHPNHHSKRVAEARATIVAHYGGRCTNCGQMDPDLLTVEHIQGRKNGSDRYAKVVGLRLYTRIIADGFPDEITVLCWDCNCFKGVRGFLPPRLLQWCRIDPDGPGLNNPQRSGDVGYDLAAAREAVLSQGQVEDIPTNVRVALPATAWGEIRGRSSIVRRGLSVESGVIDTFFRGELFVLLRNINSTNFKSEACDGAGRVRIERGERIAQLILHRRFDSLSEEVEFVEDDSRRGRAGFGSTGRF